MSYIDLLSCREELGGVGTGGCWESLTDSLPCLSQAQVLLFAPLFPPILSVILAPTSLVTPQVSDTETWGSGYLLLHNRSPRDVVA